VTAAARTYDSAGITIVMNGDPAQTDSLSWSIDSLPALEIGSTDGAEPYLFSGLAGSLRLSDGSIAVGDAQTAEIRVFDSTGAFLRRFGRKGDGPGEYINFRSIRSYPGDSVFVVDYEGLRANVVAPDGRAIRSFTLRLVDQQRSRGASLQLVGIFNDGTILAGDKQNRCNIDFSIERDQFVGPGGHCEDSTSIYRLNEDGKALAGYGTVIASRFVSAHANNGKLVGFGDIMTSSLIAQSGDRFYFADAEQPEIRVYHREEGLTHVFRLPAAREAKVPTLTPLAFAGQRITMAERAEAFASIKHRKFARYFTAMHVDREGNIWIEDSRLDTPVGLSFGTNNWWIFDSTGVLITKVLAPGGSTSGSSSFMRRVTDIGSDYVLVHGTNADGAPVVRLHRIRKRPL
jgi:hypothetical protein